MPHRAIIGALQLVRPPAGGRRIGMCCIFLPDQTRAPRMDDMVKLLDARAARPELLSRQPLETVCRCVHPDGGVVYRGGLVQAGVVTIDDTTIEGDVPVGSSVTRRRIVDEILGEAEAVDSAETLEFGDRRGDESPDRWVDRGDRRVRLREAFVSARRGPGR